MQNGSNIPTINRDIWCPGHGISRQSTRIFGARAQNFPTVQQNNWCPGTKFSDSSAGYLVPGHGISRQSTETFGARDTEYNNQREYLVPGHGISRQSTGIFGAQAWNILALFGKVIQKIVKGPMDFPIKSRAECFTAPYWSSRSTRLL